MSKHITVLAKPSSRTNDVEKIDTDTYLVRTTAPAQNNKANQSILKILSKHLGIPRSRIILTFGSKSTIKEFLITEN